MYAATKVHDAGRFIYLIIWLSLWITPGFGVVQDSVEVRKIMQLGDSLKARYAPDKRTALFELFADSLSSLTYRLETTERQAAEVFLLEKEKQGIRLPVTVRLLPDPEGDVPATGIVRLSVANMRVQPRHQAELATQVLLGTQITILKKTGNYYLVQAPDRYIAYMDPAGFVPVDPVRLAEWQAAPKVIFTADYGHVYTAPDPSSQRVSDLVLGNVLRYEGKSGDFTRVGYPDGRSGYILSGSITNYDEWLAAGEVTADQVIRTAKNMMGLPYLWGGTSVKGVDCSGFTKTSFHMNGLMIPRDASQQVQEGMPVDILSSDGSLDTVLALKNLKPGDLLFFAAAKGVLPDPRVTHVALYTGGGTFIHAAGQVRVNSLLASAPDYDAHQAQTIVAARRFIGVDQSSGLVSLKVIAP